MLSQEVQLSASIKRGEWEGGKGGGRAEKANLANAIGTRVINAVKGRPRSFPRKFRGPRIHHCLPRNRSIKSLSGGARPALNKARETRSCDAPRQLPRLFLAKRIVCAHGCRLTSLPAPLARRTSIRVARERRGRLRRDNSPIFTSDVLRPHRSNVVSASPACLRSCVTTV